MSLSSANLQIRLQPGEQMARFIRDLFPGLPEDFAGTLSISAGVPLVATTLCTKGGLPLSSLQLDSLELASSP